MSSTPLDDPRTWLLFPHNLYFHYDDKKCTTEGKRGVVYPWHVCAQRAGVAPIFSTAEHVLEMAAGQIGRTAGRALEIVGHVGWEVEAFAKTAAGNVGKAAGNIGKAAEGIGDMLMRQQIFVDPISRHLPRHVMFADITMAALDATSQSKGKKKKGKRRSKGAALDGIDPAPLSPPAEAMEATAQADDAPDPPSTSKTSARKSAEAAAPPPSAAGGAGEAGPAGSEARLDVKQHEEENDSDEDVYTAPGTGNNNQAGPKLSKQERQRQKELKQIIDVLIQLTPHQREQVFAWDWEGGLAKKMVKVNGKPVALGRVLAGKWDRVQQVGTIDPLFDMRDPASRLQELPPALMRPWARKMELPLHRHLALGLDLLGRGNVFRQSEKWLGFWREDVRDYAFGIYGKRDGVRDTLGPKWARRKPAEVLPGEDFYQDIMDKAPKYELTLMAVAARPLPYEVTKKALMARLLRSMGASALPSERHRLHELYRNPRRISAKDMREFARFNEAFGIEDMKGAGLVDEKGQLKEDTTLIFTTLEDHDLAVEAIQPGIIRDRKGVWIGQFRSPLLTRAIFDLHLGPYPLNQRSKRMVGNDTLYAANGFTFEAQTAVPNMYLAGEDGGPSFKNTFSEELMLPTVDAFHMYSRERAPKAGHLVLGNISRALGSDAPRLGRKKRFFFF
eukprot:jgi/Botrbrau1/2775/Bobra.0164s0052.1